ncbi:MAG: hypothetical protein FJ224_02285, partial [Lentisphaerae bacterium]|nr:hypothetical protein [Lentisphaerota bacterium]
MKPLLRRITGTAWFHAAVVTAVLLWVFSGPLFSGGTLASGDNAAVYPRDFQAQNLLSLWGAWAWDLAGIGGGGAPFLPQSLLAIGLPPNIWNPAMFMVDTLALFLAVLYFLRGRGYRGTAAFLPALAFTFSGYGFTLISAGHRGIFHM